MAGQNSYLESDGKAVNVSLLYAVDKNDVVIVETFIGIAADDGSSGDTIALSQDDREYQFIVPSGLAVAKGAIVYLTVATVTGHRPDDAAWTTSAGAGKIRLFRATAAKDANNMVTGFLLVKGYLS